MHFYDKNGNSAHEIIGKNGKLRATTIKDARELGLVPSVSTVKDLGVGYGLINWMLELMLDSAWSGFLYKFKEDWKKNAWKNYNKEKGKAAERGTEIHNILDKYFITGKLPKKDREYITPVIEYLEKEFHGVEWVSEASFVHPLGFGGRVDLHSKTDNIVLDFKTKDKTELTKSMQYDDHKIQLSAYQEGLRLPIAKTKRYNLFISVHKDTPGQCLLVEADRHDYYYDIFVKMLELWKLRNKYDSSEVL